MAFVSSVAGATGATRSSMLPARCRQRVASQGRPREPSVLPSTTAHRRCRPGSRRRTVPCALVFTSKPSLEGRSVITISGTDRRGHLLSIVNVFDGLSLTLQKGVVLSSGNFVNDTFTLSKDGEELDKDTLQELRDAIEAIDRREAGEDPNVATSGNRTVDEHDGEEEREVLLYDDSVHIERDFNSGAFAIVDNDRSPDFTSITISAPNGKGVFAGVLQVLGEFSANITFATLSCFDDEYGSDEQPGRRHDIIHIVSRYGKQYDERARVDIINRLGRVFEK